MVNTDGTGLTRLTDSAANDTTPVWSPDGAKVLFASDRAGGAPREFDTAESYDARDVFNMDVSAGLAGAEDTVARLIENPADDMHPEWADGGRTIVLNRVYETGDGADIVVTDSDGRNERIVGTRRGWSRRTAIHEMLSGAGQLECPAKAVRFDTDRDPTRYLTCYQIDFFDRICPR